MSSCIPMGTVSSWPAMSCWPPCLAIVSSPLSNYRERNRCSPKTTQTNDSTPKPTVEFVNETWPTFLYYRFFCNDYLGILESGGGIEYSQGLFGGKYGPPSNPGIPPAVWGLLCCYYTVCGYWTVRPYLTHILKSITKYGSDLLKSKVNVISPRSFVVFVSHAEQGSLWSEIELTSSS